MTSIRCPICKEVVTGDTEQMVSHSLRDHFVTAHEIKELRETQSVGVPTTVSTNTKETDRTNKDRELIAKGAVPPEMTEGEDMEESVLCPFCGNRVFGHDEDDLSDNLHDHMESVHSLRPVGRILSRLR